MTYYIDDLSEGATKIIAKIEQFQESDWDWVLIDNTKAKVIFAREYNDDMWGDEVRYFPYPRGAKVGVRERGVRYQLILNTTKPDGRTFNEIHDGEYAYESDGFASVQDFKEHVKALHYEGFVGIEVEYDYFQPPECIPIWAIRKWLTVSSVAVKQVKELSGDEIQAAGYKYLNRMPLFLPPETERSEVFALMATIAQGVLIEQHPDWTPDTWVELATLEEK